VHESWLHVVINRKQSIQTERQARKRDYSQHLQQVGDVAAVHVNVKD